MQTEIRMDVKEAVRTAREYVTETFADEDIRYVGLEEVTFDDAAGAWKVTIGFFRPWNQLHGLQADTLGPGWKERSFKIVQIDDGTGRVVSMTHRTLPAFN